MRARKETPFQCIAQDRRLRAEIEADVFELWVGISRLLSRLQEPEFPHKDSRRRRRAAVRTRPA